MQKSVLFLMLMCFLSTKGQHLEDSIYKAIDNFYEYKNTKSLQELTDKEFVFEQKVNSKEEHLALVILQCNKAYYLKEQNRLQEAIVVYEKAWKRFDAKELNNYDIIEYCLKPLGNLYTKVKDYINAENTIKHYISLAETERNNNQKFAGIINLCLVYQSIQKHNVVIEICAEALKNNGLNSIQKEKIEAIKDASLIVLQKVTNQSLDAYSRYKEKLLTEDYLKAKYFFQEFKKGSRIETISKREKAKLYLEEAQLYVLLQKEKEAAVCLDTVFACFFPVNITLDSIQMKDLYAESLLIDLFDLKAFLQSDFEKTLSYYDKSFYVTKLIENKITSQDAKIILQSEKRKKSEACIEMLLQAYGKTKNENLLEKAFMYANIAKSDVLLDQIQKRNLQNKYAHDSLLIQEKNALKEQEKLTQKIIEKQRDSDDFNEMASIHKQLAINSFTLKELQENINSKYYKSREDSVLVKSIQKKLKDKKTVFVLYFYGRKNIYQFIINKSFVNVNTIELTSSEVEKEIVNYIQLFNSSSNISNDVSSFQKKAYSLYKKLKFDKLKDYKEVILVTDGLLNFISFETLLTSKTNEQFFQQMPFVVQKQNVVYAFSSSLFLQESSQDRIKQGLGIFPVFANTPKELKNSIDEAKSFEENFSEIIYKEEQATKSNFINNIDLADIVHLSTHAKSGEVVTDSYIDFYDDKLYINELYSLDCTAKLVVLSACETGVGRLLKGEGAISVARAFRYIGAENLLFSLWEINDKSTAILMGDFYEVYKNKGFSDANRQTKLNYLQNDQIENYKKSPYYWGAFVYYGSVSVSEISSKLFYIIIGVVAFIMIFLPLVKQKFFK